MKCFIYGLVFGVLCAANHAWAPTIANATPADYARVAMMGPIHR